MKVLLEEQGVRVTTAQVDVGSKTYAVHNLTSVEVRRRGFGIVAGVVAFFGVANAVGQVARDEYGIAAAFAAVGLAGLLYGRSRLRTRHVVLGSSSGEVEALETTNPQLAERMRSAVIEAMGARA